MTKVDKEPVVSNWKLGTGTRFVEIYKFLCFLCQPGASHQNSELVHFMYDITNSSKILNIHVCEFKYLGKWTFKTLLDEFEYYIVSSFVSI